MKKLLIGMALIGGLFATAVSCEAEEIEEPQQSSPDPNKQCPPNKPNCNDD